MRILYRLWSKLSYKRQPTGICSSNLDNIFISYFLVPFQVIYSMIYWFQEIYGSVCNGLYVHTYVANDVGLQKDWHYFNTTTLFPSSNHSERTIFASMLTFEGSSSSENLSLQVQFITNHQNFKFALGFSTLAPAGIQLVLSRWSKWHDIYSRQVWLIGYESQWKVVQEKGLLTIGFCSYSFQIQ